jgi:hypothetical protein
MFAAISEHSNVPVEIGGLAPTLGGERCKPAKVAIKRRTVLKRINSSQAKGVEDLGIMTAYDAVSVAN